MLSGSLVGFSVVCAAVIVSSGSHSSPWLDAETKSMWHINTRAFQQVRRLILRVRQIEERREKEMATSC